MEENNLFERLTGTFDQLDENELTLVLNQVARRMLVLRCTTPDAPFWHGVIMRVNKWLSTEPIVSESERKALIAPGTGVSGRVNAIKSMRLRSGMQLTACKDIVDDWIGQHISIVHESVKSSYFTSEKNRKKHNVPD